MGHHRSGKGPARGRPPALEDIQVDQLAFAPDGHTLAVASDAITLWDLGRDDLRPRGRQLFGHSNRITSLMFTPDGHALVSGSADRTAIVWDLDAIDVVPQLRDPMTGRWAAFSPDRHIMATAEPDNTVQLWDVTDPARPVPVGPPLAGQADLVRLLEFSADGQVLATGSDDNTVALWDLTDPSQPRPRGQPITVGMRLPPGTYGSESLDAMALSPDGRPS